MSACMTIIVVPGSAGTSIEYERRLLHDMHGGEPYWSDYDFRKVDTWSHGWPFEYMCRPYVEAGFLIDFGGLPVSWSTPRAWEVFGYAYAFSPLKLLADLFIGGMIVFGAVAACEAWRRRRRGFRFSLLDAIVVSTTVRNTGLVAISRSSTKHRNNGHGFAKSASQFEVNCSREFPR